MARRKLTVDRHEEIKRRLADGRSLREIASALGCSRRLVRQILSYAKLGDSGNQKRPSTRINTDNLELCLPRQPKSGINHQNSLCERCTNNGITLALNEGRYSIIHERTRLAHRLWKGLRLIC
jgi:hypothetical protein